MNAKRRALKPKVGKLKQNVANVEDSAQNDRRPLRPVKRDAKKVTPRPKPVADDADGDADDKNDVKADAEQLPHRLRQV